MNTTFQIVYHEKVHLHLLSLTHSNNNNNKLTQNNFKNTPNTLFFKTPDWLSISFLFHFYATFYSSFLHNGLFKHVHLVTYSGVHFCNTSKWEAEKSMFEAHLDYTARSHLKNEAKRCKDVVLSTITPIGTTSYSSLISSTQHWILTLN